jgi:transcriptional regulator with XRE-family HTH domain
VQVIAERFAGPVAGETNESLVGLGSRIRYLRERQGLSLGTLAPKLGLTKQALSKIERGEFAPSIETLCSLAAQLNVPINAFLEKPVDGETQRLREHGRQILGVMEKTDLRRAIAVLDALARTRKKS